MKKLMIAAAAICTAIMANAAAANWKSSASQIHDGTGSATALYSGTAYIFDASLMSQSALFALIAGGTDIGSSTAGYITSASVDSGAFSANFSYAEQGSSTAIPYYFVIVDTDKAYFSNEKSVKPNGNSTAKSVGFGIQYDDEDPTVYPNSVLAAAGDGKTFAGAGRWNSTSSIPEPTSGLLMLLGVAGLALKRKRA